MSQIASVPHVNRRTRKVAVALAGAAMLLIPTLPGALAESPVTAAAPAKKRTAPTTCVATAVSPGAGARARYVWKRLVNAGYSTAAAAGVVGYLDEVSAVAPHAISRANNRVGVAQWPADRWADFIAITEEKGQNRWDFKKQVNFLLDEMAGEATELNNDKFKVRVNPRKAARVFNRDYLPIGTDPAAVKEALGLKADGWFRMLGSSRLSTQSDAVTYGGSTQCAPAEVDLDRCPMVPDSFKKYFANSTGFTWDDMSASAQLMSRCAYIRFPHIKMHGTYNGHMPVWSQAIDFMMPKGCVDDSSGPRTRSETDLHVGSRLAKYLFENHKRLNIDYMIWQDSLRNPGERSYENEWAPIADWRDDGYNNGNCTNTHFDHVHVSVYPDVLSAGGTPPSGLNPDGEPW